MTVAHLRYMRKMDGKYGIDILTAVAADSMDCPASAQLHSWWQRTADVMSQVDAAVKQVEANRAAVCLAYEVQPRAQDIDRSGAPTKNAHAEPGSDSAALERRSSKAH
jgi:hypothetical protein